MRKILIALACIIVIAVAIFKTTRESFVGDSVPPVILHGYSRIMEHLKTIDYSSMEKRIPRILFRTFSKRYEELPDVAIQALKSSTSRDIDAPYHVLYFSEDDCRQFIREHRSEYLDDFDVLVPGAYRADLWRLIALHEYGGVYNDLGHVYIAPVDSIIDHDNDELVLTMDRPWQLGKPFPESVHNAFMASYKSHPVIGYMLEWVGANIRKRHYGDNVLDITGPVCLARALNTYFGRDEETPIPTGVFDVEGNKIKVVRYDIVELSWEDKPFLHTKFADYKGAVYPDGAKQHYSNYWDNRNVYGEQAANT